jgi:hypothetical protein
MSQSSPRVMFTQVSGNAKTGPIPVSGSQAHTCPVVCPFRKQGCYAKYGPISWHWSRLNGGKIGGTWKQFILSIQRLHRGQLWRHNQFGDLESDGKRIDAVKLAELTKANTNRRGFTYTHHLVTGNSPDAVANRKAIAAANQNGFTVNLSGNNLEHADKLAALKIGPVVAVVPADSAPVQFTPAGHKVIVCPAQTRENVTCSSCQLCAKSNRGMKCNGGKQLIIGFLPHGMGAKYAERVASRSPAATATAAA